MDISKAFCCLSHFFAIFCSLRLKLMVFQLLLSNWKKLLKCSRKQYFWVWYSLSKILVLQGSFILFKIFFNEIFHFHTHRSLYNYTCTDNITLSNTKRDTNTVISTIEKKNHFESDTNVDGFSSNQMKANHENLKLWQLTIKHWANTLHLKYGSYKTKCEKKSNY